MEMAQQERMSRMLRDRRFRRWERIGSQLRELLEPFNDVEYNRADNEALVRMVGDGVEVVTSP